MEFQSQALFTILKKTFQGTMDPKDSLIRCRLYVTTTVRHKNFVWTDTVSLFVCLFVCFFFRFFVFFSLKRNRSLPWFSCRKLSVVVPFKIWWVRTNAFFFPSVYSYGQPAISFLFSRAFYIFKSYFILHFYFRCSKERRNVWSWFKSFVVHMHCKKLGR